MSVAVVPPKGKKPPPIVETDAVQAQVADATVRPTRRLEDEGIDAGEMTIARSLGALPQAHDLPGGFERRGLEFEPDVGLEAGNPEE